MSAFPTICGNSPVWFPTGAVLTVLCVHPDQKRFPDRVRALRPPLRVYLSGNIAKGSADPVAASWDSDAEEQIRRGVGNCEVETLNPACASVNRGDPEANFGCDLYLVKSSDAVLVDASGKRGLGVGAEMMFARMREIPVISICPPNSTYRQDHIHGFGGQDVRNWTHPFVHQLSSHIADDLEQAITYLRDLASSPSRSHPFDPDVAITHYLTGSPAPAAESGPRRAD